MANLKARDQWSPDRDDESILAMFGVPRQHCTKSFVVMGFSLGVRSQALDRISLAAHECPHHGTRSQQDSQSLPVPLLGEKQSSIYGCCESLS